MENVFILDIPQTPVTTSLKGKREVINKKNEVEVQ